MALPSRAPHLAPVSDAPPSDWRTAATTDHFVQFYEDDRFLLDAVAGFIGEALHAGEVGIVIATAEHRAALAARLAHDGHYVATAQAEGRYVALDAASTLAQFMVAGIPDPRRFATVIGNLIRRAGRGGRRVRAFGEMVALLAANGNYAAALQLECLWTDLQRSHPFTLFCAYPLEHFDGVGGDTQFDAVCAAHRRVIPAESYTALSDADDRLREIAALQQKALRLDAAVAGRSRMEEQLLAALAAERAARAAAEAALRTRDNFLLNAAHELKTPLTVLKGYTQLLLRRLGEGAREPARLDSSAQALDQSADQLIALTGDLLDIAKVQTGQVSLLPRPLNIVAYVRAAVARAGDRSDARHHITVEAPAALPPLHADAERLDQVLDNLLDNAVKYTPDGGEVAVTVRVAGAGVTVGVWDNGMGLPPGSAEVLFTPFGRAANAMASSLPGMGLGLAICRGIIDCHGGWITVASAGEDQGTTVIFWLPFAGPTDTKAAGSGVVDEALDPPPRSDPGATAGPLPVVWSTYPAYRVG